MTKITVRLDGLEAELHVWVIALYQRLDLSERIEILDAVRLWKQIAEQSRE